MPDMVGLNVQGELETWRAEELSRSILYSRRVMDEMSWFYREESTAAR